MAQSKNNQPWQIRPDRQLVERLERLVKKFPRESANKLAVEILNDCVDIWERAEQARVDSLADHKQKAEAIKNAMLQRLHPAVIVSEEKPDARKRGRK